MIDGIIRNKIAAPHHARYHNFIAILINFLLRVQKTKGNVLIFFKVAKRISDHQLDHLLYLRGFECLFCQLRFFFQDFKRHNVPPCFSCRQ